MYDRREVTVDDWCEGEQVTGKVAIVGADKAEADSMILLALELESQAEEIPEGCYPESFGPGPHFIYPQVLLSPAQAAELRDHLTSLLERQAAPTAIESPHTA